MNTTSRLALDIGGANLKLAHASGAVVNRPFALWRTPERLVAELRSASAEMPPRAEVLVTMTAELCDCFPTKKAGVLAVLEAVSLAYPGESIRVWGVDGRFDTLEARRADPLVAAAANWLALARVSARLAPSGVGLLVDIGSTTTDLVRLRDGRAETDSRTDTDRLASGELVYAGVIRTPLCALATSLQFRGRETGLCAELFATTRDVHLVLGDLAEDPADRDTADGRPATIEAARTRLARMIGADGSDLERDEVVELAREFEARLLHRLVASANRVLGSDATRLDFIAISGAGEFLAERLGVRLAGGSARVVRASRLWNEGGSSAACAWALLELAAEREREPAR